MMEPFLRKKFNGSTINYIRKKQKSSILDAEAATSICSMKKGVLRNLTKFTGKHLYQSFFF